MTILTPNQIGVFIYEVGGWGPGGDKATVEKWLDTAIAVCYGESGFDTRAKNAGSSASGLYQIMTSIHEDKINDAQKRWWGEDGWPENKIPTIFDPRVNIDVARMISQEAKAAGKDEWSPWEAYNNKTAAFKAGQGHGKKVYEFLTSEENIRKAYKELMAEIKLGHAVADLGSIIVPGGLLANAAANAPGWMGDILEFVKKSGIAVGAFLLGAILLILGIWFILGRRSLTPKVSVEV